MKEAVAIRKEIVELGKTMSMQGLVAGTWGNISARVPETPYIAITPSGMDYRETTPDQIVIVNGEGATVDGSLKPSSEMKLHLAVYRHRPDIQAIVHTHSIFASACAVAGKGIPPIVEDLVQIVGGGVEVAPYALPGTQAVADNAVLALGKRFAVLLESHGVVGAGNSLAQAFTICQLVEKSAQIYLYAQMLGGAKILSETDVTIMHDYYKCQYGQR
jgi:L-fuculose-phosphate aldolase